MRVVTRGAAQPLFTLLEARTGLHLHHLTDGSGFISRGIRLRHEDGPNVSEIHSRSKVAVVPVRSQDFGITLKMALVADRIAPRGVER